MATPPSCASAVANYALLLANNFPSIVTLATFPSTVAIKPSAMQTTSDASYVDIDAFYDLTGSFANNGKLATLKTDATWAANAKNMIKFRLDRTGVSLFNFSLMLNRDTMMAITSLDVKNYLTAIKTLYLTRSLFQLNLYMGYDSRLKSAVNIISGAITAPIITSAINISTNQIVARDLGYGGVTIPVTTTTGIIFSSPAAAHAIYDLVAYKPIGDTTTVNGSFAVVVDAQNIAATKWAIRIRCGTIEDTIHYDTGTAGIVIAISQKIDINPL